MNTFYISFKYYISRINNIYNIYMDIYLKVFCSISLKCYIFPRQIFVKTINIAYLAI